VLWVMRFLVQDIEIKFGDGKLILYFYASQMPYHLMMLDLIEKVEKGRKGIVFVAIDAEYFEGLCRRFEVKSVPTIIALNNGTITDRIVGVPTLSKLADICHLGEEHEEGNK
jgi:thioredoxin-like negative regulator of GroEL